MKIFINQDSKKFVSSQKFNAVVNRFDFKRGDTHLIEIGFVENSLLVPLVGSFVITFALKESGKYDGSFLVSETNFVLNGSTGFFQGTPNFNTVELNDLLNANDGDDTNDIPYVDCLFEISVSDDNGISSSATSVGRVYHDVIKGDEGVPVSGTPVYPPASEITDHLNDTDDPHATLAKFTGAAAKTTPIDADVVPILDSADSSALKKLTFANLWTWVKSKTDPLYVALTGAQSIAGVKTFTSKTKVTAGGTNDSQLSAGTLELQSYALGNSWIGDNVTFTSSSFRPVATGVSSLFYFAGTEGHFRFAASATAGSAITPLVKMKVLEDGTFATGFNINSSTGSLSNAKFIVDPVGSISMNGDISFFNNSGTWNGAIITGAQSFSNQLEATGQAANTDDSLMTLGLTEGKYGGGFEPLSSSNIGQLLFPLYSAAELAALPTATRSRLSATGACRVAQTGLFIPELSSVALTTSKLSILAAATPYAMCWDNDGNFRQFGDVSTIVDFQLNGRTSSNDVCQNYISFGSAFIDSGGAQYGVRMFTDDQTSSTVTIESYTNTGDSNLLAETGRTVHTSTTTTNDFSTFSVEVVRVGTSITITVYNSASVSIFTHTFTGTLSSKCAPFIKVENNPNASTLGTNAISIFKTAIKY